MSPASLPEADPHARTLRRIGTAAALLLLVLGIGAAARVYSRSQHDTALAESTARNAQRHVLTTEAREHAGLRRISLPGTLRGQREAAIHARASGYLKSWTRDIGQTVRAGELLAVIDAPESEQELAQARAAREQIRARSALAASSLQRWEDLRQRDAVSQQELDERRASQRQAVADLAAADANIRRLEQLQAFRRVTAPFSGTVVRRNVDVGALISAGSGAGARELFYLAQTDVLRLDVAVPQAHAASVRAGQAVELRLAERGGAPVIGQVERSAGAIDPATRSMQVEIRVPNAEGRLLPGAYVEATLPLAQGAPALVVPPNVLQFRQQGARVATVQTGADGVQRVALRPVTLGRDLGRLVEIRDGLQLGEVLVMNPHDAIEDGEAVVARAVPIEPPPAAGRAAGATAPAAGPGGTAPAAAAGTASGPAAAASAVPGAGPAGLRPEARGDALPGRS